MSPTAHPGMQACSCGLERARNVPDYAGRHLEWWRTHIDCDRCESRMLMPSRLYPQIAFGLSLAAFGLLFAACSSGAVLPPSSERLALGTWGGDNAGVIVSDSGTHVHVGCTLGDMPGLVPLDPDGRFVINGSYVLRAYPIMVGPTLPAQFSGQVRGRTLTIAIAVNDTVAKQVVALGPITVTYGRTPSMGACPICRAAPRWP